MKMFSIWALKNCAFLLRLRSVLGVASSTTVQFREDGIHTFFTVKFPILDTAGNIAAPVSPLMPLSERHLRFQPALMSRQRTRKRDVHDW